MGARLIPFISMTVFGEAGWYMASWAGFFWAFMASMVMSGVGLFVAIKIRQNYF